MTLSCNYYIISVPAQKTIIRGVVRVSFSISAAAEMEKSEPFKPDTDNTGVGRFIGQTEPHIRFVQYKSLPHGDFCAAIFIWRRKEMKNSKILIIAECAVMIALSTVLSLIKVYQLPLGGSITLLSMLPVMLLSVKHGLGWGFASSFVYAGIQIMLSLGEMMGWGMTPFIWFGCLTFDYLIPFMILGIAGILRKKGITGVLGGITIALCLRFVSHLVSGLIFFDAWCPEGWNLLWYSVAYNGSFMLPELIITLIGAFTISKIPHVRKLIGI